MRQWTLLMILLALLCTTGWADQVLYRVDFEGGQADLEPIRRYPDTVSVVTSAPEGMTGAFPPPSGGAALQVLPSPDFHNLGAALGGPLIDRRDASYPSTTIEARIFLVPSSGSDDNNFALLAIDDSGAVTQVERYYRFGHRSGSAYFQIFDGAEFTSTQADSTLGAALQVPGWHSLSMTFEGPETIRLFIDGQEASFSPIQDSTIPRVQLGLLAWCARTDLPLLADDLRVTQVSPDAEPREVIVEVNVERPEDGTFFVVDGDWDSSTGKSRAEGLTSSAGIGSLYVDGGESGTAVFTPNVAAGGLYEVFVTWCTSGNATDVLYNITHASGRSQVILDQDGWGARGVSDANQWNSLGTYRLSAGTSNSVAVMPQPMSRAISTANAHRIYADALRIVPTDGSTTAVVSRPPQVIQPSPAPSPMPPPTPVPAVVSANEITWRLSISSAMAEAQMRGCLTVIYAYTDRARACREIESTLFDDSRVIVALNAQCPVRIDMDRDGRLANDYAIYRVPTLIVLNHTGDEIGRHVGPIEAQELIELVRGR